MQNDDDTEDIIFQQDQDHVYKDREEGSYYLCMYYYEEGQGQDQDQDQNQSSILLLANTVSASVYLKNKHNDVVNYLVDYSMFPLDDQRVDIIKLSILPDLTYSSIVKTYWIRLIQRHWRNTILNKQTLWKTPGFLRSRELGVRHCRRPSIRGLLSVYGEK